jgi:hypothetical protein
MCFIIPKVRVSAVAINPLECRNCTLHVGQMGRTFVLLANGMIEVFKTNVDDAGRSKLLVRLIAEHFAVHRVNFDLEDCDKVLRVEGQEFCPKRVIDLLKTNGHHCEIMI